LSGISAGCSVGYDDEFKRGVELIAGLERAIQLAKVSRAITGCAVRQGSLKLELTDHQLQRLMDWKFRASYLKRETAN
jgi:hypothetical protein